MIARDWQGLATWLGAGALVVWLAAVLRFWWQLHDLGEPLPHRANSTDKALQAIEVLLSFYEGRAHHDAWAREAVELREQLTTSLAKERRARWWMWLLPTRASRLLTEAWSAALDVEHRTNALLAGVEARLWRKQEVTQAARPTSPAGPDPLAQKIARVEALLPRLLGDWHAMELDLTRRTKLGGTAPDALVNEARAAMARPDGRSRAWQALADAAWACAVAASWGRRGGEQHHAAQQRAARSLLEAEKQGTSAHRAPPFSHDHDYTPRVEASRQADALVDEGKLLLDRFAWGRADQLFQRAVPLYLYTIDRTYNPLDQHNRLATGKGRPARLPHSDEGERDEEQELPDLDLGLELGAGPGEATPEGPDTAWLGGSLGDLD